jgi:ribosomal protein S6--L-glutamate ligase
VNPPGNPLDGGGDTSIGAAPEEGSRSLVRVALERRLAGCPHVITLGVKPNFSDYSAAERELIRKASKIYYPSVFYADLFDALGKTTFPSYHTYKFAQDKIKQSALFNLAGIPHPRTRVFFGRRQKAAIETYFGFPLIAKIARGSSLGRGVFLIQNSAELASYCSRFNPAYIQEYLPIDRDMRLVVIGRKVVHAYWRIARPGEFRANVGAGGTINFAPIPEAARCLALQTAAAGRWDDVGIDICLHNGQFYVLEVNMKYGREGFRNAGVDYYGLLEQLIVDGTI